MSEPHTSELNNRISLIYELCIIRPTHTCTGQVWTICAWSNMFATRCSVNSLKPLQFRILRLKSRVSFLLLVVNMNTLNTLKSPENTKTKKIGYGAGENERRFDVWQRQMSKDSKD